MKRVHLNFARKVKGVDLIVAGGFSDLDRRFTGAGADPFGQWFGTGRHARAMEYLLAALCSTLSPDTRGAI